MTKRIAADQVRRARQWARDILDDVENGANVSAYARDAARTLTAMMPRPTLADMTREERRACQWMQADIESEGRAVILLPNASAGLAILLDQCGESIYVDRDRITPRPDLPRMEWPEESPVPPNTMAVGSVWDDVDKLSRACDASGRTQITAIDREGDVSVWEARAENWHGPHPIQKYAPYTITHTGRKDHQ